MKKELNEMELEAVAGGRYDINIEQKIVGFRSSEQIFRLKCSPYVAMEAMDGLIGKYATDAEYDQACINMLRNNGWIN